MGGLPNAQPMSMSAKQPVLEEGHGMADMEGMGGMHGGMGGLAGRLVSAPGGQIGRSEGWAIRKASLFFGGRSEKRLGRISPPQNGGIVGTMAL